GRKDHHRRAFKTKCLSLHIRERIVHLGSPYGARYKVGHPSTPRRSRSKRWPIPRKGGETFCGFSLSGFWFYLSATHPVWLHRRNQHLPHPPQFCHPL